MKSIQLPEGRFIAGVKFLLREILFLGAVLFFLSTLTKVSAAVYYWDTDGAASGLQSGTGTWDASSSSFWSTASSGSTLTTWVDGSDAYFQTGGTYAVTVSGTVNVGTLQSLATTNLTLNGGTISVGTASADGAIKVGAASSPITINSNIILSSGTTAKRTLLNVNGGASSSITINGTISESAANTGQMLRVTGAGSSVITLTGNNSFTGGVQIHAYGSGTQELVITNKNAIGTGAVLFGQSGSTASNETNILTANFSTASTVSNNLIMRGDDATYTGMKSVINSSGTAAATFTGTFGFSGAPGTSALYGTAGNLGFYLGGTNTGNNTFDTIIKDAGTGFTTTLTKQDGGTWVLTKANTYTGATTVTGGKLFVDGSLASGSSVSVASGATLSGVGVINGTVSIASGGILAGVLSQSYSSTGTLKTGALTLAGSYAAKLSKATVGSSPTAGSDYDQVSVTGTVDVTGGNLQLILGSGIQANDIYYILTNDGSDAVTGYFTKLNGSTTTLTEGASFALSGYTFKITYLADSTGSSFSGGNDIALMAVAIPEVPTVAFLGIGIICLAGAGVLRRKEIFGALS